MAAIGAAVGGLGAIAIGATGLVGLVTAAIGGALGHTRDPDPQKDKWRR